MALNRFDALLQTFAATGTRRSLVGTLGGGLLALASPLSVGDPTVLAAKKKKNRKKSKSKQKSCPKARRCKKKCCRKGQTCQQGVCKKRQTTPPEPVVTRVRRDLHSLSVEELASLERGVAEMMERSRANDDDPTGWTYQAKLHAINAAAGNIHFSIHFLSWHRMYLYYFEQILRDAADDPTLTLPYWDYSIPANRVIPGPFRDSASGLYNPTRREPVNAGAQPGSDDDYRFDDSAAMAVTNFTHYGAGTSFGGRVGAPGLLETSPHNHVHSFVGGNMNSVPNAPLDPLFWLHHANIDRLWEAWLRKGGGRSNPTSGEFLTRKYNFYDKNGNKVQMTGSKILDTASQLHYTYAGQEPLSGAALRGSGESSLGAAGAVQSTVVGSANSGLKLGSRAVDVEIPLRDGAGDALAAAGAAKKRTTLTFTGVAGAGVPGVTYEVHVNASSKSPRPTEASFVGAIGLFGLQPDDHPGHHHSTEISFDITKRAGNGKQVEVTLVPSVLSDSGRRAGGTWATIEGVKISVEGAGDGQKKTTNQNKTKPKANRKRKQAGANQGNKKPGSKQKAGKQRPSQNKRKRTVNPKQKQATTTQRGQATHAAAPAIPGGKSSASSGDVGTETATASEHAHH